MADTPVAFDVELEQALLGALLIDKATLDIAAAILEPKHLYDPLHGRIYEKMMQMRDFEVAVTPLTLFARLKDDAGLAEIGGKSYLATLAQASPVYPPVADFCRSLKVLAVRREIIAAAEDLAKRASENLDSAATDALIDHISDRLHTARAGVGEGDTLLPFIDHLRVAEKMAEEAKRLPDRVALSWGLVAVDEHVGRLFRTDLVVLGGATSMAKTSLAEKVFETCGRAGKPCIFFSLEMPGAQLGMRTQSRAVRVSSSDIRRGRLSSQQIEGIVIADREYADLPMYVDSRPRQSVAQMRAKVQQIIRRHGDVALVVVDHLQYVTGSDPEAKEYQRLGQITKDLKALANELNTTVLLLSHLTKENERRDNPRPRLNDLFGAAAIQQDADMVAFVYRDYYYAIREPTNENEKLNAKRSLRIAEGEGKAEIYSDKNRLGPIGRARVAFNERFTEFSDLEGPRTITDEALPF